MMKVYIDDDFKCYTTPGYGRTEIDSNIFNGLCKEYIEGMRYVPEGRTWEREDGEKFSGPMLSPASEDYAELERIQHQHFIQELINDLADADAGLTELGVI